MLQHCGSSTSEVFLYSQASNTLTAQKDFTGEFKANFKRFGKCAYSLSAGELNEKMYMI